MPPQPGFASRSVERYEIMAEELPVFLGLGTGSGLRKLEYRPQRRTKAPRPHSGVSSTEDDGTGSAEQYP